jgi:hypothetical protein
MMSIARPRQVAKNTRLLGVEASDIVLAEDAESVPRDAGAVVETVAIDDIHAAIARFGRNPDAPDGIPGFVGLSAHNRQAERNRCKKSKGVDCLHRTETNCDKIIGGSELLSTII